MFVFFVVNFGLFISSLKEMKEKCKKNVLTFFETSNYSLKTLKTVEFIEKTILVLKEKNIMKAFLAKSSL